MNQYAGMQNACDEKVLLPTNEVREPTIFEVANETKATLHEVLEMLCVFSREIENRPDTEAKLGMPEACCFTDDIHIARDLAFAIRGDLKRLISKFHP